MRIFYVADAFSVVIPVCEISQRWTDTLEKINDVFVQFDWYLFPNKIQRMLPTILILTQQPLLSALEVFQVIETLF